MKCLSLKGLLSVLFLFCSSSIWATDFSVENDDGVTIYYNILSADDCTVEVTYEEYNTFNSYSGDVVIPETVEYGGTTYTVTAIGTEAFAECNELTSVTLPNTITSIGNSAFYKCENVGFTSIIIPDSVTSIDANAFKECTHLTRIVISTNSQLKSIGYEAFYGCSALTSIVIPSGVTSIGNYAFSNCNSLTTIDCYITDPSQCYVTTYTFNGISSDCTFSIPEGSEDAYESSTWNSVITSHGGYSDTPSSLSITVNAQDDSTWYATYYNGEHAYVMPEGVTGCTVTVDDDGTLRLNEAYPTGATVPAGTPLLLTSDEEREDYIAAVSSDTGTEVGENMLYGSDTATTTTGPDDSGSYYFYKLSFNSDGEDLGFYWGADEGAAFTSAAHKAWLAVPVSEGNTVKLTGFSFGDADETTGIQTVEAAAETPTVADGAVYNMAGQRVNGMTRKGVYIVNGKKYIKN